MKRHAFISILLLLSLSAGAQNWNTLSPDVERGRSGSFSGQKGLLPPSAPEMKTLPVEHDTYNDDGYSQMEEEMNERSWKSEDTAWERACKMDTKDAYRRYIAIYPSGAHRAEATRRMIDREVDDILDNAHEELPGIEHVLVDNESPTSTIIVENHTGYVLTVYYSGIDSRTIQVSPDGRGSVTLTNGPYRIAASVPPTNIRPYAGKTQFIGGRYETKYYVVPVY